MTLKHAKTATLPDQAGVEINKAEWNADHIVDAGGIMFNDATVQTTAWLGSSATSLVIGTLGYTDTGIVESLQASTNSYVQAIIRNTSNGNAASSDIVVNNDQSTGTTFYGDFGMNSSTFVGTGSLNAPNYVYVTSTSADLVIGTTTANAIHFITNSAATDAGTISNTGSWTIPTAGAVSNAAFTMTGAPFTGGSGTTTFPLFYMNSGVTQPTTFSTAGTMFGINAPSGFTGNLIHLFLNGTSEFSVSSSGGLVAGTGTFGSTIQGPRLNLTSPVTSPNGMYLPATNTIGITANSLDVARFLPTATSVDYVTLKGSATGSPGACTVSVDGTDTNIDLIFAVKGTAGRLRQNGQMLFASATPGIAAGAGAGTAPTVAIAGTNEGGIITVTTGTLPGASAVIATITPTNAYPNNCSIVLYPANSSTAILSSTSMVFVTEGTGTWTFTSGTVNLVAATAYKWHYHVIGY